MRDEVGSRQSEAPMPPSWIPTRHEVGGGSFEKLKKKNPTTQTSNGPYESRRLIYTKPTLQHCIAENENRESRAQKLIL
jgi:hypothetical protein